MKKAERYPVTRYACRILLVMATMAITCCDAAPDSLDRAWRPCRAANRRRYDEVISPVDDEGEDDDEDVDLTGAAYGGDDGGGGVGDLIDGIYDEFENAERWPSFSVDEKPKRGARVTPLQPGKPYEKNFDPRSGHPVVPGGTPLGNGLRVDASLLRDETVELPTYVNVPVTLRCKFVPLAGTENKFETVVEAMYPGHPDAPSPPPDSYASQILKQLVDSVDGWHGIVNKSTRPVRRVVDNRFGWRPRPSVDEPTLAARSRYEDDDGEGRRADSTERQIAARLRAAAERQRFRDARRRERGWPIERGLVDDRSTENRLIEDPPSERQADRVDDQRVYGRPSERVYDPPVRGIYDRPADLEYDRSFERVYDPSVRGIYDRPVDLEYDRTVGRVHDSPAHEIYDRPADLEYDRTAEKVYDRQVDGRQAESVDEQQSEPVDALLAEQVDGHRVDGRAAEQVDDRVAEQVDDRVVEQADERVVEQAVEQADEQAAEQVADPVVSGVVPAEELQHLMAVAMPEMTVTTTKPVHATFVKGIPVNT